MAKRKSKKKEEEIFHVEVITKARVAVPGSDDEAPEDNAGADWEYYVKWAGYDSDANSWEPSKNVESCERLLASFWDHVGIDNKDYFPGDVICAKEDWIEKEKAFFAKEYQNSLSEKKKKKDERRMDEARKKKSKKTSREPPATPIASSSKVQRVSMSEDDSSESSAEEPPKQSHPIHTSPNNQQSLKIKLPASNLKKRKTVVSSSSDDEPLAKASARPQKIVKMQHGDISTKEDTASTREVIEIPSSPNSLFSEPPSPEPPLVKLHKPITTSTAAKDRLPKKQVRRTTNPQGKIAIMAPSEIPTAGGISTKQRLAQGALAPTAPKEIMAQPTKTQPKAPILKSTYSGLNFKKKSFDAAEKELAPIPLPSRKPSLQEPMLLSLGSPVEQSPSTSFSVPTPSFVPRMPSLAEPTVSPASIFQLSPVEQANEFLREMMPPSMAAPMSMEVVESPVEVPPPKAINPRIPLPGRVRKEWNWTGPLFLKSKSAHCNVKIHNVTTETSLRFSTVFQNQERIEVFDFYDVTDIRCILLGFRKPSQLGQLVPSEEADNEPLGVLATYLDKKCKGFLIPIIFDDNVIGQILCVSFNFYRLFFSEVPPEAYKTYPSGQLIAIILPYTLAGEDLKAHYPYRVPDVLPNGVHHTADNDKIQRSMRTKPQFHHALNMLNFPSKLVQYVSEYTRPYAIWTGRDTSSSQKSKEEMETRLLEIILKEVGAKKGNIRSECRMIFVHAGAIRTSYQLPEFVERRAGPQHMFYIYGSHPDIPHSLWSVSEIWPCGGVVTFSPSAMRSNPHDIYHLMTQINRHPLWTCYILPSALGMVATMECGTEDPLKIFNRQKLLIDLILQAIEDGSVSLLEAPPEKLVVKEAKEDTLDAWFGKYITLMPPTKRQALETALKAFNALPDSSRFMEEELMANMSRIHRHPALISEYRRYVIICSERDDLKINPHLSGFEWTTAAKFDFKDEFYPKQTIGSK
ncbi:hypothetical protein BDN70DRAFT_920799 [Pholiota conissans]|uniref:Chromo domain-containing protein n=1 Tax=Pholiota conissans TaxID=109636 RepID=A0A9P5Z399_9AGAR|nr:hypothetical protein BDN70DRAFT_920799 [Pholiota conissans]